MTPNAMALLALLLAAPPPLPTLEAGIAACSASASTCANQQERVWRAINNLDIKRNNKRVRLRDLDGATDAARRERELRTPDEAKCDAGDADACFIAGDASRWKLVNDTMLEWEYSSDDLKRLVRGCTLGHVPACVDLAIARHDGVVPPVDDNLDDRLCRYGIGAACVFAPPPPGDDKPRARLRLACARGSGDACGVLGVELDVMALDAPGSRALLERGCALGSGEACHDIHQEEPSWQRVDPRASAWWGFLAKAGAADRDAAALAFFVDRVDDGARARACAPDGDAFVCWMSGPRDEATFPELCRRGVGAACVEVAQRARGRPRRDVHRMLCLERQRGESCVIAGRHNLVEPDAVLLERGCALGAAEGCSNAAALATDPATRRSLHTRACTLKHTPSCRVLEQQDLVPQARGTGAAAKRARATLQTWCSEADRNACDALAALTPDAPATERVAMTSTLIDACLQRQVACDHADVLVSRGEVGVDPGVAAAVAQRAGDALATDAARFRKIATQCRTLECRQQLAPYCHDWGYDEFAACEAAMARADPDTALPPAEANRKAAVLEREACGRPAFARSQRGTSLCAPASVR